MKDKSIDELLALAAEGDEEAQNEIKSRFQATQAASSKAQRELKLKTDPKMKERYPRALLAYEKGKLVFDDDVSEEDMANILRDKEEELAELGVPLPGAKRTETITTGKQTDASQDGDDEGDEGDPALALGTPKGASSPGGEARDLVNEFFEHLNGPTLHDQANAYRILVELQKPENRDRIAEVTERLSAKPKLPVMI